MSEKARDGHGRWRSKTIAFRVSPQENALLEDFVRLSGYTKQEYIISRVLNRDVVVYGNTRVYKALREKMEGLCERVGKLNCADNMDPETVEVLKMVATIYREMKSEV